MTQSLAFCTLPKKWLSIIFERGDPMHLLPVPNLLIRMNLFFAQVQADFRTDEVRIAKILSRLVQRTEGETIWAWRKSKTVVGVSWQYEIILIPHTKIIKTIIYYTFTLLTIICDNFHCLLFWKHDRFVRTKKLW